MSTPTLRSIPPLTDQLRVKRGRPRPQKHVTVRRVLELFWPHTPILICVIACICLGSALGLVSPFLTALIIDHAIAGHNARLLVIFVSLMVVAFLLNGLVSVLQTYLTSVVGQRITAHLRESVFSHLLNLPFSYFQTAKLGDLLARFNSDIVGVQGFVAMTGVGVIANVLVLLTSFFLIAVYDWRLAVLAAIIVPMFTVPTRRVGRKGRAVSQLAQSKIAGLGAILVERLGISGIMLVKLFERRKDESERFRDVSQELMRIQIHQSMVGRWLFMFTSLFSTAAPAFAYLIGGLEVMGAIPGQLTLGETVAVVTLFNRLYLPAIQLLNTWVDVQRVSALLDRIFEVLDEPTEMTTTLHIGQVYSDRSHPLSLDAEHVSFSYAEGRCVLDDITFHVRAGSTLAIVGPSGTGKSTLLNLIPRLFIPNSGVIRLGDQDIQGIPLHMLRQRVGMVTQDVYLLHATIFENIAYGRQNVSEEDVICAARAAHIHDVIASLPQGYRTLVGERGYRLSGGEKQRIAIARVLLKDPSILLLDEATSALDAQSEAFVQAALKTLMRGRTTLVVAHRLSTVRDADTILVLDGGRIIEYGTHNELIGANGLYSRLYSEQAQIQPDGHQTVRLIAGRGLRGPEC